MQQERERGGLGRPAQNALLKETRSLHSFPLFTPTSPFIHTDLPLCSHRVYLRRLEYWGDDWEKAGRLPGCLDEEYQVISGDDDKDNKL